MAYVPGFAKDVFISFAHLDNDKSRGGKGWVADFELHLLASLQKQLSQGKQVEVWRDVKLAGNDVITQEIQDNLRSSAVLVCLVSPSYLSSTGKMGCLEELELFGAHKFQGLEVRVDNKLRIFKVLLRDVLLDDHPEKIRGLRGYRFFDDPAPVEGWSREYWPRPNEHPDNRYWLRLDELASDIARMLTLLRSKVAALTANPATLAERPTAPTVVNVASKPAATIYLAETADDLQNDYYWVRSELERKNIRVLPEELLPTKRADAEPLIRQALAQSQIAVHLFSKLYGRRFVKDGHSLPHLQYELAIEVARDRCSKDPNDKFLRIAWIPTDLDQATADPAQQELLKAIETEELQDLPIDVQSLPHDQLQRLVDSIAGKVLDSEPPPPESGALIYVTGTAEDLTDRETKALIDYIRRRRHEVFMPTALNDQAKRERQDQTYMQSSDGLVILYGKAPSEWVVEKALAVRKLARSRRKNPLAAAVFDGPPEEKDDLNLFFDSVSVLKSRAGFQPKALHPFLKRIEGTPRATDDGN